LNNNVIAIFTHQLPMKSVYNSLKMPKSMKRKENWSSRKGFSRRVRHVSHTECEVCDMQDAMCQIGTACWICDV